MMIHARKIEPSFFESVLDGSKTFEVRKEEYPSFAVGDFLALNEWDGAAYTGRCCLVEIVYILSGDGRFAAPGVAVLSIKPCAIDTASSQAYKYNRDLYAVPQYGCCRTKEE